MFQVWTVSFSRQLNSPRPPVYEPTEASSLVAWAIESVSCIGPGFVPGSFWVTIRCPRVVGAATQKKPVGQAALSHLCLFTCLVIEDNFIDSVITYQHRQLTVKVQQINKMFTQITKLIYTLVFPEDSEFPWCYVALFLTGRNIN